MALPVNIDDLLNKRKVESNRIEFKSGWNPDAIYRSICAFANDYDNLGGGYILVGVKEKDGVAVRPVEGLRLQEFDGISKAMLGFDKKLKPYYAARTSVEEVDGKHILAIWVPSGVNRPYQVPKEVTGKGERCFTYIRKGSNSVVADISEERELISMAAAAPYDDCGNPEIKLEDISGLLLRDYLASVGSKLSAKAHEMPIDALLEQMDLFYGPTENRMIKNVAAMMFCETPERFFPRTQVDIVLFPEGRERNPDNMVEVPPIKGAVPSMIRRTLEYLNTNVVREIIQKTPMRAEAARHYNYPYAALEEAVVNALFHRDYTQREPVEITVEPSRISILSYSGPDRSISIDAIRSARELRSRRYRNRRLGDFLKELKLTEGRATGIPTIQRSLMLNGSAKATISTDDDRTFFLIDIPCHAAEEASPVLDVDQVELLRKLNARLQQEYPSLVRMCRDEAEKELFGRIMLVSRFESSALDIMKNLQLSNRYRLLDRFISPMCRAGLLERTHPENLRHRNQKYNLSAQSRSILESLAEALAGGIHRQ